MKNIILVLLMIFASSCLNDRKEIIEYYPTGEVECRSYVDKQGVYEGDLTCFYRNGTIKNITPFDNHHINGIVKKYYANGAIRSEQYFKNGKPFGLLKENFKNGRLEYMAV
ncbi:toxin-antitoxin system YwqK family antitoxin, partial [Hymenobacter terrestris]|nr:hypothetical protein [Hymenobacter terrestris]